MEAVIVRIRCITEVGVYQPDASADAVPAGGYAELGARMTGPQWESLSVDDWDTLPVDSAMQVDVQMGL
ncbi:MAG: hypothetical protein R3C02_17410 [Planctomycetaceae bacterium]